MGAPSAAPMGETRVHCSERSMVVRLEAMLGALTGKTTVYYSVTTKAVKSEVPMEKH